MTKEDFIFWSAIGMLANVIPQMMFGHLFFQWRRLARRSWVKYCFLLASVISFAFVVIRVTGFILNDDLYVRLVSMWIFVGGNYYVAIMFAMATNVVKRRVKAEEILTVKDTAKTSDLLCAVSCELKEIIDKHTPIQTNAHTRII